MELLYSIPGIVLTVIVGLMLGGLVRRAGEIWSFWKGSRGELALEGTWHTYRRSRVRDDQSGDVVVIEIYERWEIRRARFRRGYKIEALSDRPPSTYHGRILQAEAGYYHFQLKNDHRDETVNCVMRIPDPADRQFTIVTSSMDYVGNPHATAQYVTKDELVLNEGIARLDQAMLPSRRSLITVK